MYINIIIYTLLLLLLYTLCIISYIYYLYWYIYIYILRYLIRKRVKKGLLYFIFDVTHKFVCINWFLLCNTALILLEYLIFCVWLVTVYFLHKSCELLFQNNVKFCSGSSKKKNLNLQCTWKMFQFFVITFVKSEYVFCNSEHANIGVFFQGFLLK